MDSSDWGQRSDAELVFAALFGNLEAFGELVKRFRPAVFAVVYGIVDSPESAEDVVQDTFLLAFKALPQIKDPNSFACWLHAIARNRAIRHRKRSSRTVTRSSVDMFILRESKAFGSEYAINPAYLLEREETCREVREALAQLPEQYQTALRLRYWAEMPVHRLADFLGTSVSVVKWRIYKGKQLLKQQLEKEQREEYRWSTKEN